MFEMLVGILKDESIRQALGWLGGGMVTLAGGLWTVFTYLRPSGKKSGEVRSVEAKPIVTGDTLADRGAIAAGGDIIIDNSQSVRTGLDGVRVTFLSIGLAGCLFLALSLFVLGPAKVNNVDIDNSGQGNIIIGVQE